MQVAKLLATLLLSWLVITVVQANNVSTSIERDVAARATTNDDQSKIIIKHSIIFHIMKNVKAIESDIFVTRKIDLTPIIKGIDEVSNAGERVNLLCKEIPNVIQKANQRIKDKLRDEPKFRFIKSAGTTSHTEARQKCMALGYRLPEIYSRAEFDELKTFMQTYRIATTHAGLYFDENYAIYRFYSTGLPSWKAFHTDLYHWNNDNSQHLEKSSWAKTQDEPNVRFFYSIKGQLLMRFEEGVITRGYFRRGHYRDHYKDVPEANSHVICQTKWEGEQFSLVKKSSDLVDYLETNAFNFNEIAIRDSPDYNNKKKRQVFGMPSTEKVVEQPPLQQYCHSIGDHIKEVKERANTRLVDLLALIEVSVESQGVKFKREKNDTAIRNNRTTRGLPAFLFMNGVRSIWGLLGFIEKIRTNRRLNKLEDTVKGHSSSIDQLSKEIQTHSFVIRQLQITTQDMIKRIDELTNRVTKLEARVNTIETELRLQQIFDLVEGLIGRSEAALSYAFTKLEDVIHSALIGHTSAFLLPPDKLQEIQNHLSKDSTAVVDSEYKHMKSIIVSDPDKDGLKLLAIVNIAALSRKSKELVRLIPLPTFQSAMTLAPNLDYNTVVLDQEAGTFTIVEPEEVPGCLYDHCVTSNPETNIVTTSCGIPQYFDRQLDLCKFEEVISNGIFLKRLGVDGIVYNVREEVTAQIFCAAQVHSKAHKISRSGIVNLPAGCTFSITTDEGKKLSIKALPVAQMIEFQQLDIVIGAPEQIFKHAGREAVSNGTSGLRRLINDHLSFLSDQLNGNSEVIGSHRTYVIVMAVLLSLLALTTTIIGFLFYRYSTRFRTKVRAVRSELQEGLRLAMKGNKNRGNPDQADHLLSAFDEPPPVPPREKEYLDLLLKKLELLEDKVLRSEVYLQMTGPTNEQIYQNVSEPPYGPTPRPKPKLYPLIPSKEEIEQTKSLLTKVDSKFNPSAPL